MSDSDDDHNQPTGGAQSNNNNRPVVQAQSQGSSSQNRYYDRKWKLRNAELRVLDIYSKTSGSKVSPLIIKVEVKLLQDTGDIIKICGEYTL